MIEQGTNELKPCPICGKTVEWINGQIKCLCGLSFRYGSFELTNQRWNNRNNWISVKDRLPEIEDEYLVCYARKQCINFAWYSCSENKWYIDDVLPCAPGYITHWIPLPELPNEGN